MVLENYGLISLLQRRVERIIVFINTNEPLDTKAAPTKLAQGVGIDANLLALFGHSVKARGVNTSRNQVFTQEDFIPVASALQAAKRAGGAALTSAELQVQENAWWGVEGGWKVQVLWYYLDRVPVWESQLGQPIRKAIRKGNRRWPLFGHGPFKAFPHYATMGENLLDLVELTPEQVNLLADLCCWTVTDNVDAFRNALTRG